MGNQRMILTNSVLSISRSAAKRSFVLAVSFTNGLIYLMRSYDDLAPVHINTELNGELGFHMEWSNSRELLAVAGTVDIKNTTTANASHATAAAATAAASEATSKKATATPVKPTYAKQSEPINVPKLSVAIPPVSAATTPSPTSQSSGQSSTNNAGQSQSTNNGATSSSSTATSSTAPKPPPIVYANQVKFYTQSGQLLFTIAIPPGPPGSPVSALTWGHSDKRLFVATGPQIHIAWVSRRVASLQLMCRLQIQRCIGPESALSILPLPSKIKSLIGHLYAQTIRVNVGIDHRDWCIFFVLITFCVSAFFVYILGVSVKIKICLRFRSFHTQQCLVPNALSLRDFVSRPPLGTRLHCTMIRHDEDKENNTGICYTLYLEYLGGLVPLLKGKRTSKIRPEFVIFDPQHHNGEHILCGGFFEYYNLVLSISFSISVCQALRCEVRFTAIKTTAMRPA